MILVYPDNCPLLAMKWKGDIFCDTKLQLGLHSAPKIFSAVEDALQWCIKQLGASLVEHYLDDSLSKVPQVPTSA